ncbi:unnamed protein product [Adineta ricciae]|uniref:Uncharacterized protein n=1 Tax=Adineta ricciae TaxID=249248 RepID=A0A815L3M2_ADIRI|nr:unnamed protein product [Adineta ricciae]
MRLNIIIIQLLLSIFLSKSSHFYGGTVTWKPMDNTATGLTIPIMFTQSYQFRRSANSANSYDYCNQSIILNESPKIPNSGQTLTCVVTNCVNYVPISINEYCTDFSSIRDSSSGQISTIENITTGSSFCVGFQDFSWVSVYSSTLCPGGCFSNYSGGWSIVTCLNLTMRTDGFINTPPVATVISPVKVPVNTITNIKIPIIDADGDYLKCRWGKNTSTINECGSICDSLPGGTIDTNNCILTFNSTGKVIGTYYAAAMMVEDFSDSSSTTPFSSVPIQFLIQIVGTPVCPLKPTIEMNLANCTAVEVGVQFNFALNITIGCSGTTITDVNTNPPLYMYKGTLTRIGSTTVWTISETWIPTSDQLGSQVYCAIATDSASIPSDQYCLTFFVVPAGSGLSCPTERTTTTVTTSLSTSFTSSTSTTSKTTTTISTSTSTSSTSTTSTTTTTVTTITRTQKSTKISINLWPIIGAVLGFLVLCALCCCCWWCWFLCGGDRHRRRNKQRGRATDDDLITKNHHFKTFPSSLLRYFRQPTRISLTEIPDRSSFESRATSTTTASSPIENINEESSEKKSTSCVTLTYVKRQPKSSFTDIQNKNKSLDDDNNNEISEINSEKIKSSTLKIDNELLPSTKQRYSVNVSRVNRVSILSNDVSTLFNGVSTHRTSNNSIKSKRLQRSTQSELSSSGKTNSHVTVTKVVRI